MDSLAIQQVATTSTSKCASVGKSGAMAQWQDPDYQCDAPSVAVYALKEDAAEELERVVEAQEEGYLSWISRELEKRVYALDSVRFRSPCTFIMRNFQEHKKQAKQWLSRPFYTAPQGYKMCLIVQPNPRYLSVSVSLMWGEFDCCLQWPVHGTVTITLLDHVRHENYSKCTRFSVNRITQGNIKVIARCPEFISNTKLHRSGGDDDCLHFRVSVVIIQNMESCNDLDPEWEKPNQSDLASDLLKPGDVVQIVSKVCGKSLKVLEDGSVDCGEESGTSYQFCVISGRDSNAIKLQNIAQPKYYLTITKGFLTGYGEGGADCDLIPAATLDHYVTFEFAQFPGSHIGVLPSGQITDPSQTTKQTDASHFRIKYSRKLK